MMEESTSIFQEFFTYVYRLKKVGKIGPPQSDCVNQTKSIFHV